MSEPSAPPDETGEALSRLASYGEKKGEKKSRSRNWGAPVLFIVFLIPLTAVAWLAWQGRALQEQVVALRSDNATFQQQSVAGLEQLAQVRQQMEEAQQQLVDAQQQLQQAQQSQQEQGATVQQTLEQELAASRASLAEQAEQLATQTGQLSAQAEQLSGQAAQLAALQAEVSATRSRLDTPGSGAPMLAEAEVLLRMAGQRLVIAHDVPTAVELFHAADDVLRDADDPALVNVRETLAREVAALEALPTVDVAGLFAKLSAEAARVESLPLVSNATVQDFDVTPAAGQTPETSDWWTRTKESFGKYFVVSRNTGRAVPQLSADDQFQMRALVQLPVEQAKLALLRGDGPLYQTALDAALAAAQRWLRSDDAGFEEFVAAVQTLRATPVTIDIPASDATLAALRRVAAVSSTAPRISGTSVTNPPPTTVTASDESAP